MEAASAPIALVRLLQLASPTLPVGAYSYSQGLEWVVEQRVVCDAASARAWIGEVLEAVMARGEAALSARLLDAAQRDDWGAFSEWNALFRASRETAELRAETEQMGGSLVKLAADLGLLDAPVCKILALVAPITFPAAFALAARALALPPEEALTAYVWSWLENQVLAAMKLVPLGQVAGQRLLFELGGKVPDVVAMAQGTGDEDVATFAPGLAIASSRHETQYSRLFRS